MLISSQNKLPQLLELAIVTAEPLEVAVAGYNTVSHSCRAHNQVGWGLKHYVAGHEVHVLVPYNYYGVSVIGICNYAREWVT